MQKVYFEAQRQEACCQKRDAVGPRFQCEKSGKLVFPNSPLVISWPETNVSRLGGCRVGEASDNFSLLNLMSW